MWWDNETIDRTVTREFVANYLIPSEIEQLDRPPKFGEGLTDGTYWEWLEEKAKKLFLILVDIGLPDQIFGLIDDSWEDRDLPIALEEVKRLYLTAPNSEKIDKKFYSRQFYYLLKPLQKGDHKTYQDDEVVPLELADKKHATKQKHHLDKVMLPNQPDLVFCRRRVPLGPGHLSHEGFLFEVNGIRHAQHDHLVSYWASYTHQGYGYILFTPATEFSLKSLFTNTPNSLKNLDKKARRDTVVDWILCLIDTVCFLHNRGLSHGSIKPSTILFSNDNRAFVSDIARFDAEMLGDMTDKDRKSFDKEAYDYAAPEQWFQPSSSPTSIYRALGHDTTMAILHTPAAHRDPQAADIFSLGCVVLELLSFLFKKHGRPFASHRSTKHRTAGRGGAVPDSSFHKNLGQVESWMVRLGAEALRKDDPTFVGVPAMMDVVAHMLAFDPAERPAADHVQQKMRQIVTKWCGPTEPRCPLGHADDGVFELGIGGLRLSSFPRGAMTESDDGMPGVIAKTKWSSRPKNEGYSRVSDKLVRGGSIGREGPVKDFREDTEGVRRILSSKSATLWPQTPLII
ncbi:hypothetical protein VTK26DRAFT_7580 [Humicola hyalothermophila]